MKLYTKFAIAAAASVLSVGVIAPVIAQDQGGRPGIERSDRGEARMIRAHQRGGEGRNRAGRMIRFMETFDTNADGDLTQEEIDSTRAERLARFDVNTDGVLTLDEFEALWLDAMRERMVDRFQSHDDDGDGQVTAEEFGDRFANIVTRRDTNGDGVLNADDLRRGGPRGETSE
ncbi:MAG: calcium-binding protein [Pseudomonadota bacterium]